MQDASDTISIRHVVMGWSITPEPKSKNFVYEIRFRRLTSEVNMDKVLSRPRADEVEDYQEYKRGRSLTKHSG